MKILLAIDESEFSQGAIREVEEHFGITETTVRVSVGITHRKGTQSK